MRELALFAGVGGGLLATRLLGWTTVCAVELDPYCREVLLRRQRDGLLDVFPIWDDVATFDAAPWRGRVDVVTAGFPCFAAGTLVLTKRGYVPIETVAVGDRCLSHAGRWRRVEAVMRRRDASLVRVDAGGVPGVVTTPEHPFFAREMRTGWDNALRRYVRGWDEPRWVPAGILGGSRTGVHSTHSAFFLGQVLPPVEPDGYPAEFWWLVGRYLADGWRVDRKGRNTGRVVICCASHEADELQRRIGAAGFRAARVTERTVVKFHITGGGFYSFLEPFGRLAHGKHLSAHALSLDAARSRALLDGYLSGDGHEHTGGYVASTVSRALALGIALLAQRAYGVVAGVRPLSRRKRKGWARIEGRPVNERPAWCIQVPSRNRSAFVDGRYGWKLARKVTPCGRGDVWNLHVAGDESYVADGAIVHNCPSFSVAGKRLGGADQRNKWPETIAIIGALRPRLALLENAAGLASHDYFGTVLGDLAEAGFDAEWGILAASDVGAPHQRERVWIAAWPSDLPDTLRDPLRFLPERDQRGQRSEP